jgi:hypothetical protein
LPIFNMGQFVTLVADSAAIGTRPSWLEAPAVLAVDDKAVASMPGEEVVRAVGGGLHACSSSPAATPMSCDTSSGCQPALDTDNRPISPRSCMRTVMAPTYGEHGVSAREGARVNAARAAGKGRQSGRTAPGLSADLVVCDVAAYRQMPSCMDRSLTRFVLADGRLVAGTA